MSTTAVAVDIRDNSGKVIPGTIIYLHSTALPNGFLFAITNNDGYAVWSVPVPFNGTLQLAGAAAPYGSGGNGVTVSIPDAQNITLRVGPQPSQPQDILLPAATPVTFNHPFRQAPRFWKGNMCGTRVPGIEAVQGGAADASLVLSWFYDRFSPASRELIRQAWKAKGLTHVLLSWPDSRSVGQTPEQFTSTCRELIADGFFPAVFLSSKDHDPADVPSIVAGLQPLLKLLVGTVPIFCIGWELSLWLSPTQVQQLTDAIVPTCLRQPGTRVYVHFQERYMAFQQPGGIIADYWNANVGKLTGVLLQRQLGSTDADFLDWLNDCLERAAGNDGMPAEIIDGHGVDLIALELNAQDQFNGTATEAEGVRLGQLAIHAPAQNGPAGLTVVMGAGNG